MTASYFRVSNKVLQYMQSHPDEIEELVFESEVLQDKELDIDKSWHGIYFLLTGEGDLGEYISSLAGQAILGGRALGDDLGYGPIRYFEPDQVKEIYNELETISVHNLAKRFDVQMFNEHDVYPMNGEWTLAHQDYLLEHYEELLQYFKTAVEQQEAMLLLIS